MSENLKLKSINDILDKDFFIPAYQRGYRWDSRQVEDLLEDILEFSKKDSEFYCLQPVVILPETYKNNDEHKIRYRVIDGQQRLTTIYIILKYLENLLEEEHGIVDIYKITYETRNKKNNSSKEFLENIQNNSNNQHTENIDFYHMGNTFNVVKQWFTQVIKDKKTTKRKFLEVLMGSDNKDIKVIWYEIADTEHEIDVFTRLNIGKIPLTNAELVKALLLINLDEKNDKLILSTQWDNIEYKLQDDKLFSFINSSEYKKATRIEFIFDLIVDNVKIEIDNLRKDDNKRSYYIFDKLIQDEQVFFEVFDISDINKEHYSSCHKRVEFLWDETKRYFRIFEELYEGINKKENNVKVYYHLVGFLISNGAKIKDIVDSFYSKNKNEFIQFLKDSIMKNIKLENKTLEELNYEDDHKTIEKVLFLFNVILTMKSGYSQYPFDLHKSQQWSLEHIHAQNSKGIIKDEDRKSLLKSELQYINDEELKKEAEEMYEQYKNKNNVSNDDFNNLQTEIFKEYGTNTSAHNINNLALLSVKDNASLSNSIFPAKRDKIKELDKTNSFIPIGTKNVFLKYFSNNVEEALTWNDDDKKVYMEAIQKEIGEYIK